MCLFETEYTVLRKTNTVIRDFTYLNGVDLLTCFHFDTFWKS